MNLTKDQIQRLVDKYPYLQPRNLWTDEIAEDYDYTYIRGVGELPSGWERLFLMFCKDLQILLAQSNYLEEFRFTEIKEKYNSMRLYTYGETNEISQLIYMYQRLSSYLCQCCGKPAKVETREWIASYCANCLTKQPEQAVTKLRRKFVIHIEQWSSEGVRVIKYDTRRTWKLYKQLLKLSDEEFIENYMLSCWRKTLTERNEKSAKHGVDTNHDVLQQKLKNNARLIGSIQGATETILPKLQ